MPRQTRAFRRALLTVALAAGITVVPPAIAAPDGPHVPETSTTTVPAPTVHPNVWAVTDGITWTDAVSTAAWYEWASTHQPRPRPVVHVSTTGDRKSCVANRENGGDYGRSSNPDHFGRYQFSRSAWVSFGGDPSDWGSASPDEQDRVFDNAWSQGPTVQEQQWLRWDGC
jgi:hypothetical protein